MPLDSSTSPDGLLIAGHGTRDGAGQREFFELAEAVASRLADVAVEPCFLELCEPSIPVALQRLVERGCRRIVALPLLLLAAGHVRRDIPFAVCEAAAQFANVELRMAEHLGCHRGMLELSRLRRRECLESLRILETSDELRLAGDVRDECDECDSPSDEIPSETTLLLVSRGSTDPRSREEMYRFARLGADSCQLPPIVGYYAMARPTLEDALRMATQRPGNLVIVQPHLLFRGEILLKIAERVATWQAQEGRHKQWVVTQHLGPHGILAEQIVELYFDACAQFSDKNRSR